MLIEVRRKERERRHLDNDESLKLFSAICLKPLDQEKKKKNPTNIQWSLEHTNQS
jgi:hypothetical protein